MKKRHTNRIGCTEQPRTCFIRRTAGTFDGVIVFCPVHAAAPTMRDSLYAAQEALDVLAEDSEEAGYPTRAKAATKQAMNIRVLLQKLK